jgi:hypothetical protein
MNPEQNKHHSCGHTMHVIDLQANAQVKCDDRNEVKGKPYRN